MSDARSLPRWKRGFLIVSLLICLFTVNVSLFTVRARANAVDADYSLHTLGVPVTLEIATTSGIDALVNRPNVYYIESLTSTPSWFEGLSSGNLFQFTYGALNNGVADIVCELLVRSYVNSISIDEPIFFRDYTDLNNFFNFTVGVYDPKDNFGYSLSSVSVNYRYTFLYAQTIDNQLVFNTRVVSDSISFPVSSNSYIYVPFFNSSLITAALINDVNNFVGADGYNYCWLIEANIKPSCNTSRIYFEPIVNSANQIMSVYQDRLLSRSKLIYDADTVNEVINFSDLDWTSWLTNSVGAFMDFEIVPGLSISGIFALLIGMSLFMIFLKVFAGG